MERSHLNAMSTEELWALHLEVTAMLAGKIIQEKNVLEGRLRQLNPRHEIKPVSAQPTRRAYPPVLPKYRNHAEPAETWSGRGKQPRWLTAQLASGKHIEDFRVDPNGGAVRTAPRELRLAFR
jgi:DNA-binding protein H-NS